MSEGEHQMIKRMIIMLLDSVEVSVRDGHHRLDCECCADLRLQLVAWVQAHAAVQLRDQVLVTA